jgi:hypothetical protein
MLRVTKIHSNLLATKDGPAVTKRGLKSPQPVHLRQSQVDRSCGPHCVFMALIALRLVSRDWLTLGRPTSELAQMTAVWRRAARTFMSGTTICDLARLLRPLSGLVSFEVSRPLHAAYIPFAVDNLMRERLVILRIKSARRWMDHWVLAVGVEGMEKGKGFAPEWLLLLDPNDKPIPMLQWNTTLALDTIAPRSRARVRTASDGKATTVTLHGALAIGRQKRRRGK